MKPLLLVAILGTTVISWADVETKSSRWYIHIDFPAKFEVEPLSHEGERKWWAKYDDPDSELSISTNSYGYINDLDLLLTVPGWNQENFGKRIEADQRPTEKIIAADAKHKTVRSYFLSKIIPPNSEKKEFPHYVRYIARTDSSISVYYFNKAHSTATYGHCYETLSFSFPKGSFQKHETVIAGVIASARPWLSRYKSEQDGADQPATAPKSKSEGHSKPKTESEGRSR